MATCLFNEDRIEIPGWIDSLDSFRRWALSDEFPERGRIDYIDGRIEVDTMVEDFYLHGTPKSEVARVILSRVKESDLGEVLIDRMRVSCPSANLSVEPDLVFVSHDAIESGRISLVESQSGRADSYVEIVGPPDLVVEVVSDSSVEKDNERLFRGYHAAGVQEYWLVDARSDDLQFVIWHWQPGGYEQAEPNTNGYQTSNILNAAYLFKSSHRPNGRWKYDLLEAD